MKKILAGLLVVYGLVFYAVLPIKAAESTTTYKDIFKAGKNIVFSDKVSGDLYLAGSQVIFDGEVGGDLIVAAGKANLKGKIGQNLRAAGGQININSTIGRNALIVAGEVTLSENTNIGGSLTLLAGNTNNSAAVNFSSQAAGGQFRHDGIFMQNFKYRGDEFAFGTKGKIAGNFSYQTPKPVDNLTKSQVGGTVEYTQFTQPVKKTWHIITWPFKIAWLFLGLLIGWGLLRLFPQGSQKIVRSLSSNIGKNLLWGIGFCLLIPILLILLALTIIGIPLIPATIMLVILFHLIARIYAALSVGQYIFKQRRGWALLAGLMIILFTGAIPFIGGLLTGLLYLASTGNLVRLVYLRKK